MERWSVRVALTVVAVGIFLLDYTEGKKKCLKDDTVPEYEVNVYYCDDSKECCVKDYQFTCCDNSSTTSWKNQVIIFSVCIGVIVLIFLAWMFYRHDTECIERPILSRCPACCRCKVDDGKELTGLDCTKEANDSHLEEEMGFKSPVIKFPPQYHQASSMKKLVVNPNPFYLDQATGGYEEESKTKLFMGRVIR